MAEDNHTIDPYVETSAISVICTFSSNQPSKPLLIIVVGKPVKSVET